MTPFQEFRLWARRAPRSERASAAVSFALVAGLIAYVAVPGGTSSSSAANGGIQFGAVPSSTAPQPTGSDAGTGTTTATSPTTGAGPTTSAGTGTVTGPGTSTDTGVSVAPVIPSTGTGTHTGTHTGTSRPSTKPSTAAPSAQSCPPSNAKGVTDKQIKVAVTLTAIANSAGGGVGNASFGVASIAQQKAFYDAAIADLNARGGVACRTIVQTYYNADPVDQNQLAAVCKDIVQAGMFAVLDTGAYAQSTAETCYAQNKIVYIGGYLLQEKLREQFYPYLFELGTYDRIYHDTVFALAAKGAFSAANGFKKLGIFYRTCFGTDPINATKAWLNQAGVPSSQIVTYDIGCPAVFATPADIQQAILTFRNAGVTHITYVQGVADLAAFTQGADQQQIHSWKYLLPDDEMVTVTSSGSSTHPQDDQINGAIAVASARDGEESTPGYMPSAGTKRCDAIFAKYGNLAPTYKQPYAGGNACDEVWMLEAMISHAPALAADQLATGLQRAQSIELSFPQGPVDYRAAGETAGGQFYRYVGYLASCRCWRVTDPNYQPSTYKP